MSASLDGNGAEPNLTPILDMVFQLITFFMLVINFKAADVDSSLRLPVVGSARPVEEKDQGDLIILNVNKEGKLIVQGAERPDIQSFIEGEARAARRIAKEQGQKIEKGDEVPVTVVMRADASTPFHLLYKVVKVCQEQGFRKFNYMALNKAKES
jgi:biopolymer transport protein ExbD